MGAAALAVTLAALAIGALGLAALLAVLLTRRWPFHRPVAALLCGSLLAEALRAFVTAPLLAAAPIERPFAGWARLVFHMEQSRHLAWPAGVLALAWWAYRRQRPLAVLAGWALASVALAVAFPWARGEVLARCYAAAEGVAVAGGAALWWRYQRSDAIPLSPQIVAAWLTVMELAVLLGPMVQGMWRTWAVAQLAFLLSSAGLVAMQGRWLWTLRRKSSDGSTSSSPR